MFEYKLAICWNWEWIVRRIYGWLLMCCVCLDGIQKRKSGEFINFIKKKREVFVDIVVFELIEEENYISRKRVGCGNMK